MPYPMEIFKYRRKDLTRHYMSDDKLFGKNETKLNEVNNYLYYFLCLVLQNFIGDNYDKNIYR